MASHGQANIDALRERLGRRVVRPGGATLESIGGPAAGDDLSSAAIVERSRVSHDFLLGFIRREMGDDQSLVELAEHVLRNGREGLELIAGQRTQTTADFTAVETGTEVLVRTDGTRPAYLVRDGGLVESSAPDGTWTNRLFDPLRQEAIETLVGSVGRVDISHELEFAGTAWLVAPDLVITNRHVAQAFVEFGAARPAIVAALDPHIDFGHEYRGQQSVNRRPIKELVFCGATPIPERGIDHKALDVAVFRLGKASAPGPKQTPCAIASGAHLADAATEVIVVGYPGRPRNDVLGTVSETDAVLRRLFARLYGYKRLAPGEIMPRPVSARTLSHDASTLGGNSGSLIAGIHTPTGVTALHYGGAWGGDRANWGHVLENVLDEPGLPGLRHESLRDLFDREGIVPLALGG